ncbi:LysM peptidoglycan-binding domain-containing protein [Melittangium boletus]|uniref:Peptidoglycan-binding protein LysM n=1 Tax=Melittangium boletus DSM 14713 TaxID=1294270 RepID=A0A250IHC0_9BACT|nr:LysM peptidoglycan-binding domain-containing protein [Melittangium boletus]ATB30561.1 peptidoglycan-binding protein LysM [Melittangium boletus DSM 14713]
MSYRIKSGDTLSAIAKSNHTTVSALMKANPQIKDANKIYAGKTLNIPGSRDSFEPAKGGAKGGGKTGGAQAGGKTGGADGAAATGPASQGPKGSPFDIAKSHLNKNAGSLKLEKNGVGADMEDWVPNNVNCANFVSACLEQAGQIKNGQHHNAVLGLQKNLDNDPNFKRVSINQAKPGDVVSLKTPGGHHVVMFAGMKNGKPQYIGSNNINSDGSQRISYSQMNYPIMSVHQYRG